MAPSVSVQTAGKSEVGDLVAATSAGFEVKLTKVKAVDIGLWREQLAHIEGQACRIEYDGEALGTGFLVGPDLVLTNYHVLEDVLEERGQAGRVACRFDYKMLRGGSLSEGTVVPLDTAAWKVDASPYSKAEGLGEPDREPPEADELDFALVRLARPIGREPADASATADGPKRGWIGIPITLPAFNANMPLIIAQHPDGSPMKLAFDTQAVIGAVHKGRRVRYNTNTEPGSSGSPCFDIDWTLIALHHMGDPGSRKVKGFNQGIPIHLIRERLGDKVAPQAPGA
jgi:hypothetical protein